MRPWIYQDSKLPSEKICLQQLTWPVCHKCCCILGFSKNRFIFSSWSALYSGNFDRTPKSLSNPASRSWRNRSFLVCDVSLFLTLVREWGNNDNFPHYCEVLTLLISPFFCFGKRNYLNWNAQNIFKGPSMNVNQIYSRSEHVLISKQMDEHKE